MTSAVNLTLIHGCLVMVPTRIDTSCLLHNSILLGIQFNHLDQFTGGDGGYFMGREEISECQLLHTRSID